MPADIRSGGETHVRYYKPVRHGSGTEWMLVADACQYSEQYYQHIHILPDLLRLSTMARSAIIEFFSRVLSNISSATWNNLVLQIFDEASPVNALLLHSKRIRRSADAVRCSCLIYQAL